mmetsp:Transcript_20506/g.54846  ORF Transcript_20506/g.54846 Transcript_20506/m.54846 type:complete len:239 (-) Transcript_20506:888-1604(-)
MQIKAVAWSTCTGWTCPVDISVFQRARVHPRRGRAGSATGRARARRRRSLPSRWAACPERRRGSPHERRERAEGEEARAQREEGDAAHDLRAPAPREPRRPAAQHDHPQRGDHVGVPRSRKGADELEEHRDLREHRRDEHREGHGAQRAAHVEPSGQRAPADHPVGALLLVSGQAPQLAEVVRAELADRVDLKLEAHDDAEHDSQKRREDERVVGVSGHVEHERILLVIKTESQEAHY